MRKLSKTLLSLLLIAAMLASFVVLPAAAEEPAAEQPTEAVQAAETQSKDAVGLEGEGSVLVVECTVRPAVQTNVAVVAGLGIDSCCCI